jgi:radical SAM protein with 4Fe4S-binding SPASM domain
LSAFSFIKTKLAYELKRFTALATYRHHKDALIATLSQTMPGVAIELTNICNANCTFCAYQFQTRPTGTMKLRTGTTILRPRISPCSELFSGPMVAWNGQVTACGCRDVDISELVIGDVNTEHLGEIWFGEQIKKLRDDFLTDRIEPICDSCTHYSNLSQFLLDGSDGYQNMAASPWQKPV